MKKRFCVKVVYKDPAECRVLWYCVSKNEAQQLVDDYKRDHNRDLDLIDLFIEEEN